MNTPRTIVMLEGPAVTNILLAADRLRTTLPDVEVISAPIKVESLSPYDTFVQNVPAVIEYSPVPAREKRRPTRAERREKREFERDLARHNEQLYAVHIGAATRKAGFRRRSWLARLFTGRR